MRLHIADIEIPKGRRPLVQTDVTALAESIKEIGLKTPITVRRTRRTNKHGQREMFWTLVAGRHRLAACKKIGLERIECTPEEGEEIDSDLWEIAENLHRSNMSAQDEADAIQAWRDKVKEKHAAIPVQVGPKSKPKSAKNPKGAGRSEKPGSLRHTARVLGKPKADIIRAEKIARIVPEAREAADAAGLTTQEDRLAIASVPASRQVAKVAQVAAAKLAPVESVNPIATAWDRASKKHRADFVERYSEEFAKYEAES